MKHQAIRTKGRSAAIVAIVGLLLLCALTVLAQSGRRVKKSTPLPPVPTPEASPTPTPGKSPERSAIPILVGANSFDSFGSIPSYFKESVARACADRLRQRSFQAELAPRDLMSGDASKRAKQAKEGYVVLLELRSDKLGSERNASDLSIIYIEYFAYAAVTGKVVTSGSVYQQGSLTDVIGGRRGSTGITEQRLKTAALIAADRISAALIKRSSP